MTTHRAYASLKPVIIQKQLTLMRNLLIEDLGGYDNLSAQKIIILDGIIAKMGVVRAIEAYIKETSIIAGKKLVPVLQFNYLAYRNSIDRSLSLLGLEKQKREEFLTADQLADKIMKDKESKE